MRKEIWIIWGGKKNTQDQSQLVSLSFAESQGQIKICTHPKFAIAELRRCEVWDALHYIYKWTWIIHAHVSQGLLSICVKAPSEVSESSGKGTTSRFHTYRFLIKGAKQKKTPVAGSGALWLHTSTSPQVITDHAALALSTYEQSSRVGFNLQGNLFFYLFIFIYQN